MKRNWRLEDRILEAFGLCGTDGEDLVDAMCKYLDVDTMNKMLESIATDYEIFTDDTEED